MGGTADTAIVRPLPAVAQGGAVVSGAETGGRALRGFKFLLAVLLLPACVGMTQGFGDVFFSLKNRLWIEAVGVPAEVRWFMGGAAIFGVFVALVHRPLTSYVFGHELCHALAAWLCLGSVSNLRASASGGQVTTSKSNTFIGS